MTNLKRAILLIGSPKGKNSSSASLGGYLLKKIEEYEIEVETVHIHSEISTKAKTDLFLEKIKETDIIILAAPLYVDTLPAKVIKALSLIAENMNTINTNSGDSKNSKSLIAVVNCGFPEAEQNEIALKIYEQFAKEAHFKYLGGIAVGMGGAVSGKYLSEMGRMTEDLIKGLDQAAEDIVRNKKLSDFVIENTSKPMISQKWLYTLVGDFFWKFQALKNGVYRKMNDQPYIKKT